MTGNLYDRLAAATGVPRGHVKRVLVAAGYVGPDVPDAGARCPPTLVPDDFASRVAAASSVPRRIVQRVLVAAGYVGYVAPAVEQPKSIFALTRELRLIAAAIDDRSMTDAEGRES